MKPLLPATLIWKVAAPPGLAVWPLGVALMLNGGFTFTHIEKGAVPAPPADALTVTKPLAAADVANMLKVAGHGDPAGVDGGWFTVV
jgi:hypothetical protein